MRGLCVLLVATAIGCAASVSPTPTPSPTTSPTATAIPGPTVTIRGTNFQVEVAATPEERALGLGGRVSLEEGWGMLFVYPSPTLPSFWMKGMQFAIDILCVSPEERLLKIVRDVQPEPGVPLGELRLYAPPGIVSYVLEVNAGVAEREGFAVGDAVEVTGVTPLGQEASAVP